MSKFFEALEHADRDRAADSAGRPAVDGATGLMVTAPPHDGATVRTAPPVALPEAARAPGYGAPIARPTEAAHAAAFSALLEPPAVATPGEIEDHLVSLLEPTSAAAEQYRSVRLAIENFRRERGTSLVAVSSPGRGEGKTMTAINIAGALAQGQGVRVALIEADLRHPSVATALGLRGGVGLSTYLLDPSLEIERVVQHSAGLAFAVVVAGAASSMPYELLKSPRLSALLAALRERFDYVLIDTPPALPYPDVGILRDVVDGFVMVVRANRTPREQVRDSLNAIGAQRMLGLIFNDDDRSGTLATGQSHRGLLRSYLDRPRGEARAA